MLSKCHSTETIRTEGKEKKKKNQTDVICNKDKHEEVALLGWLYAEEDFLLCDCKYEEIQPENASYKRIGRQVFCKTLRFALERKETFEAKQWENNCV